MLLINPGFRLNPIASRCATGMAHGVGGLNRSSIVAPGPVHPVEGVCVVRTRGRHRVGTGQGPAWPLGGDRGRWVAAERCARGSRIARACRRPACRFRAARRCRGVTRRRTAARPPCGGCCRVRVRLRAGVGEVVLDAQAVPLPGDAVLPPARAPLDEIESEFPDQVVVEGLGGLRSRMARRVERPAVVRRSRRRQRCARGLGFASTSRAICSIRSRAPLITTAMRSVVRYSPRSCLSNASSPGGCCALAFSFITPRRFWSSRTSRTHGFVRRPGAIRFRWSHTPHQ